MTYPLSGGGCGPGLPLRRLASCSDLPADHQSTDDLQQRQPELWKLEGLLRGLDAYLEDLGDDEDDHDDVHRDPVSSASPLHEDAQASMSAFPHVSQSVVKSIMPLGLAQA